MLILVTALVGACGGGNEGTSPTTSPAATGVAPSPTATEAIGPSPTPTLPAGFSCANTSGGASHAPDWGPGGPAVVAVRVGKHPGYDRFVLQFDGTIPSYSITRQGTSFTLSPQGRTVTVKGNNGVRVALKPENWTSYMGPRRLLPLLPYLREARLVENFEGTMQWGLGIHGPPCLRVSTLQSPPRLVVDVTAGT